MYARIFAISKNMATREQLANLLEILREQIKYYKHTADSVYLSTTTKQDLEHFVAIFEKHGAEIELVDVPLVEC